jgi:TRAP-type C4-dicarboxylate transport system permease small subunit
VERPISVAVKLGLIAASVTLFAMMGMIATEVVARAFGLSLQVADEYSGYMVVAVFFFGVAFSLREKALLRVEFIFNRLTDRQQLLATLVFDVVALVFSAIVTWQVARYVFQTWRQGVFAATPALTPLFVPQLVMPLGMALMCVALLAEILATATTLAGSRRPTELPK